MNSHPNPKPKPKIEEIVIDITDDPGCFTDVIVVLYADGFFDRVWEIRKQFDDHEEYPIHDESKALQHFQEAYYPLRQDISFTTYVRELRNDYGLSVHYESLIHKLIFTGVIKNGDYRKAYYSTVNIYYGAGPDDFEEVHAILIHQGTRVEDLSLPLREYHNLYETKTKTGKQFLPHKIKPVPEHLNEYMSFFPEQYNKHVIDQFPEVEKYYRCYVDSVLYGKKPQELALEYLGYSESQYNYAKKNKLNDYDDANFQLFTKINGEAKKISHGIKRVKELLQLI